jgi:uncharacterized phiE125 gp8 family phage protein
MYCDIVKKLAVVTDATVWPVTVAEAKAHIRQSGSIGSAEDAQLSLMIAAATVMVENHCGVSMAARTLAMSLSDFPTWPEVLWYPRVAAISAFKYYDGDNVLQTLATEYYDAELAGIRPTVSLSYGKTWPVSRSRPFPVVIEYTTAALNTDVLKMAVLMMAADLYENRESQITSQYFGERSVIPNPSIARMLNPYAVTL